MQKTSETRRGKYACKECRTSFSGLSAFLGALTTAGVAAAGGCLLHGVAWRAEKLLVALLVVSFVFPVLFLSVNLILRKKYFEKLKK